METTIRPDQLREISIFAGLEPDALATLAASLRLRTARPNTNLIEIEQPGDRVYFIVSGTVKVFVDHADGSEVILALLGPGEMVGEMSLVDNLKRSANVTTLESSTLVWMDRTTFGRQLHQLPALMGNMVTMLSRRLRLANTRLQADATLDVEGRVALQLLSLAQELGEATEQGIRIPIRLSQSDLAALVGASRVRVNQIIVEYKRSGIIDIDGRLRITLLDPEALRWQVDEELLNPDRIRD
ncbi:MAG TPA: Crp/Fnr family transcriptional regulator [Nitrolancea sp.]|nr:Crp/Fnr family transcriptional regulator [Nitrolancea sp.]